MSKVFSFNAQELSGGEVPLEQYRGKVLLIVNTASVCGFSAMLSGLQLLDVRFLVRGLVVLGFPLNQLG
ncbi:glutathione peroxidase, partial [Burkholderia pseudomallei]